MRSKASPRPAADASSPPPLFIVGAGRSGSTLLMKLLAEHRDIAWLSPISHRWPDRKRLHRAALELARAPLLGRWVKQRFGPREAYGFWESHSPGFRRPHRDLVAADVTESRRAALRTALEDSRTRDRPALVAKLTGWPRIGFLHEVFPEARFVHLVRDGRAVAASYTRMPVEHWWGWRGPDNWRFGPLSPTYQERWDATGQSYVALAGIQWMLILDAVDAARPRVPASAFLELRYEDLCADLTGQLRRLLDFAGLRTPDDFEHAVAEHRVSERNDKWRADFTPAQQQMLADLLGPHLRAHGYEP
jgi:omega-hydroxy-beta-dihydromenaquinone-9 sulfotransferase